MYVIASHRHSRESLMSSIMLTYKIRSLFVKPHGLQETRKGLLQLYCKKEEDCDGRYPLQASLWVNGCVCTVRIGRNVDVGPGRWIDLSVRCNYRTNNTWLG